MIFHLKITIFTAVKNRSVLHDTLGSVVEHPFRDRKVVGSNPGRAIPKALKMVPVATLHGAQYYKPSTDFSSPNKYNTANLATLTKNKKSDKKV